MLAWCTPEDKHTVIKKRSIIVSLSLAIGGTNPIRPIGDCGDVALLKRVTYCTYKLNNVPRGLPFILDTIKFIRLNFIT